MRTVLVVCLALGAVLMRPLPAIAALPASPAAPGSSLVLEPAIEPVLTDNFNPFDTKSPLGIMGAPTFVYEPLLEYNELEVNQYYPWLAQSWSFSTSGQTLTFTIRSGVTWDDGAALTAADAAYTFNLLRTHPQLDQGIPIVSAVATNATTFTLTLSQPGYAYLYAIARVPIVKSGFAQGHDLSTYVVKNPDGTGPYKLAKASDVTSSRVVLTARTRYWQHGSPSVEQLVFPAYKNVAAAQAALLAGKLDWAGNFMPNVRSAFEQKNKTLNHFWGPAVGSVALLPNRDRYPLDQLAVRQAVSASIGRAALSTAVTGGIDPAATTSSALVTPLDNAYLTSKQVNDLDGAPEPALAQRIMSAAGFHKGAGGYWEDAGGQTVAFSISAQPATTSGTDAALLAKQLRAGGFDVSLVYLDAAHLTAAISSGDFDSAITWGTPGPTPYYAYEEWLAPGVPGSPPGSSSPSAPPPRGSPAAELAQYRDNPSGSGPAQAAISALAGYVSAQLPVIALMYSVSWGEYSTRHASGWPNGSNPYEPAAPSAPFDEYTVLQLTPAG